MGQTRRYGFRCPEDDSRAHVHQASALAPFDDLGVLQTGQWPPPRFGISPPAALALWLIPFTVGMCSDLITSAVRLDYSATVGWDSVRIAMPSGCHYLRMG